MAGNRPEQLQTTFLFLKTRLLRWSVTGNFQTAGFWWCCHRYAQRQSGDTDVAKGIINQYCRFHSGSPFDAIVAADYSPIPPDDRVKGAAMRAGMARGDARGEIKNTRAVFG